MTKTERRRMPRQLHIIDDTILATETKTPPELSTARKAATPPELSTARKVVTPPELSTAREIKKIEQRRIKAGITVSQLCATSGVHKNTYEDARAGRAVTRASTVKRLNRAADALIGRQIETGDRHTFIQSYLWRLKRDFARKLGMDPEVVLNQDFSAECTNDKIWMDGSRVRGLAIYVLVEGLMDGKRSAIARAADMSRQAVHKRVEAIEKERMRDEVFDEWMQREIEDVRPNR